MTKDSEPNGRLIMYMYTKFQMHCSVIIATETKTEYGISKRLGFMLPSKVFMTSGLSFLTNASWYQQQEV
jgi:hypothetical protein